MTVTKLEVFSQVPKCFLVVTVTCGFAIIRSIHITERRLSYENSKFNAFCLNQNRK